MNIFITGISGQLGTDIKLAALLVGHKVLGCSRSKEDEYTVKLDLCDYTSVKKVITEFNPDVIIHTAAWTAVDAAELPENMHEVFETNVTATNNVTAIAKYLGSKLIYISTDYVFNASNSSAICTPRTPNPINYYGFTKYLGEQIVQQYKNSFIVRVSWLYGLYGNNFVKTMLNLSKTYKNISVVNDQFGRPTNTVDVSNLIINEMIYSENYSINHVTNEGEYISWYDFAKEILKDTDTKVIPVSTEEYYKNCSNFAQRPKYSKLSTNELIVNGFKRLPEWKESLNTFKNEYNKHKDETAKCNK